MGIFPCRHSGLMHSEAFIDDGINFSNDDQVSSSSGRLVTDTTHPNGKSATRNEERAS